MLMFFASAFGFLKSVPWPVYAAIALAAVWYIDRDNYGDAREYEGRAAIQAKYDREARKQADALAAASLRYEQLAQTIRASERTDRETIREIYKNVQVASNCAVPDAAVGVLNNAVTRANAAASGQSGSEVSRAP